MKTLFINATLVLPDKILDNASLLTEDRYIKAFGYGELPSDDDVQVVDLGGKLMTPGLIDLHLHGGGGFDFIEPSADHMRLAARAHLEHGTTALLPSSCASTNRVLFDMFAAYRTAIASSSDGARMLGIHLEGPYLSLQMKGAMQAQLLTDALPAYYMPVLEAGQGIIARWTIAPEREGALELSDLLVKKGIIASVGHTTASPRLMRKAADHGFTLATHLYNAMTAMHKEGIFRLSGAAEGALAEDRYDIEVVADGIHQPLEILNIAWRVKGKDKMALITDSTAIAGCPIPANGRSILAQREVIIEDGVAKLDDRSAIAGSIATGDVLLKKGLEAGIPLLDTVTMLTATPARILGRSELGSIREGKLADLVVWNSDYTVNTVYLSGKEVYHL